MRRLLKRVFLAMAFLLTAHLSRGQILYKYSIIGVGWGSKHYAGDITSKLSIDRLYYERGSEYIAFYRRTFNREWSTGLDFSRGKIYAYDINHSRVERGFELTTSYNQLTAFGEWSFFRFRKKRFKNRAGTSARDDIFSFYLKGGGGAISFTPNLYVPDSAFTEGLNFTNGRQIGFNCLTGGGLRMRVSSRSQFALEALWQFMFSDNLDGFEVQDYKTANDVLGGISLRYEYVLF